MYSLESAMFDAIYSHKRIDDDCRKTCVDAMLDVCLPKKKYEPIIIDIFVLYTFNLDCSEIRIVDGWHYYGSSPIAVRYIDDKKCEVKNL